MLKTILFLAVFGVSSLAHGASVDLTRRLERSNDLFVQTQKVRPYLYDQDVISRLGGWLNHYKNEAYVVECQFHMRAFFRSDKVIGPLCYFLRQDDRAKRRAYIDIVNQYVLEIGAAVEEIAEDPRFSAGDRQKAEGYAAAFKSYSTSKMEQCFEPAMNTNWQSDGSLPYSPFSKIASCFHQSFTKIGNSPFFAVQLTKEFAGHPGHAVSPTGWIAGNKVTYLYWNPTTDSMRSDLENIYGLMKQHYPLSGAGSLESMRRRDLKTVFSKSEGFFSIDNDPIWTAQHAGAIFPAIRSALDNARKEIFIDVFFLGSSMGASLAKHLVATADRGVKVVILRDNYNHFGHAPEMLPVFNYLSAYAEKNPDKMLISASYIKAHSSGLPNFLASAITDEFLEKSGLQKHLSLYGRAQSDHSKVFVIDGTTDQAVAFVGSKNITDASGGVTYDEVAQIEGPAASVVLDDFYWDMFYALKYEMPAATLKIHAEKGWSKNLYRSGQSTDEMVANVLRPFDLLGRDKSGRTSNPRVVRESAGNVVLRTGMNNVDSTRTNCVDQVIQMIMHATKNIYIKDQFIFDRNVTMALVRAKKARPSLDIRLLLEPLQRANPKGLPNLLYLDILKDAGVQIRWKKIMHGSDIHSEYHMKTISADGQSVITGSANKDQTTMYGAFREQQVDIWDVATTKVHDDVFIDHWNSNDESEPFNGFNFTVPHNLTGFDGKPMSPDAFIILLRNIVSVLFDAQTM